MRIEFVNRAAFRATTPEDDAILRRAHAEGATLGIESATYLGGELGPWEGGKALDMSTTTLYEPEARVRVEYPGYDGPPQESRGGFFCPLPEGCSVTAFALFAMSRVRHQK